MENAFEWVEPKEWFAANGKYEIQGAMGFFSTLRIVLVSSIIIWLFATWMERTLGPMDFDWFFYGTLAVSSGLACVWLPWAIFQSLRFYYFRNCPPTIRVDRSGVTITNGNGPEKRTFPFTDIRCIEITVNEGQVPLLAFERCSQQFKFAIAPEIDLEALRRGIEEFR